MQKLEEENKELLTQIDCLQSNLIINLTLIGFEKENLKY